MPRIPPAGEDDRTRRAINRLTGKTRTFSMGSAGTKTYTVPAAPTAAQDGEILRALLDALADKGIISLEQT